LACAGSGGAAVRPRGHHQPGAHRDGGRDQGASARRGDAGRCFCAGSGSGAGVRKAGVALSQNKGIRLAGFLLFVASQAVAQIPPARIAVDATDSVRRIYHVRMTMPVKPGPLTLLYPQWIPGEHGPTGPITDLVNIRITANGSPIPWRRDLADMYAFLLAIP